MIVSSQEDQNLIKYSLQPNTFINGDVPGCDMYADEANDFCWGNTIICPSELNTCCTRFQLVGCCSFTYQELFQYCSNNQIIHPHCNNNNPIAVSCTGITVNSDGTWWTFKQGLTTSESSNNYSFLKFNCYQNYSRTSTSLTGDYHNPLRDESAAYGLDDTCCTRIYMGDGTDINSVLDICTLDCNCLGISINAEGTWATFKTNIYQTENCPGTCYTLNNCNWSSYSY